MRKLFRDELLKEMKTNKDIYLLLGGVGYGYFTPDNKRIIDCEASEQAMVDMAVGLAIEGKIPFVYAITPHLYRAFEGIRIYLNHHKIPVKLIGIGRGEDYGNLGFTHWATDDKEIFAPFTEIVQIWPEEKDIKKLVKQMIEHKRPYYVNLSR